MTDPNRTGVSRRTFLKGAAATAAATVGGAPLWLVPGCGRGKGAGGKRVVVIGIDGMDPVLAGQMMDAGELPTFAAMANAGGFRRLGTSVPPQSPVAWANFINGAGPGSHGVFDFIHRDPKTYEPIFSISDTLPGGPGWQIGDHELHLDFWPFNQQPPRTVLKRQGTPFWDFLDEAAIESTFYNLPSNYPPSESKYGHHRCLAGLGTPDLLGQYGTYQLFHDDPDDRITEEGGGYRTFFYFEGGTCYRPLKLRGPADSTLIEEAKCTLPFTIHRDVTTRTAGIEIQGKRILLTEGEWSDWVHLDFEHAMPSVLPNRHVRGLCRLYLQSVDPIFRLYVSPINVDPANPAARITEPSSFAEAMADSLGPFHTTGFQEAHNARLRGVLNDAEYAAQATFVLDERLALLDYALNDYDDGLLFFYFSSLDMQGHFFFGQSDAGSPVRSPKAVRQNMNHIRGLYRRMDKMLADVVKRIGDRATLLVMSDHGFANWHRQFALNSWLRKNGYLVCSPGGSLHGADWDGTRAYGIGINGLYLNLKGREAHGSVNPKKTEPLLAELAAKLEAIRDVDGQPVISKVHRADRAYRGPAASGAPDLVVGYARNYRSSWSTATGACNEDLLSDNPSPWSADHCMDVSQVPGVLFANRPLPAEHPKLTDIGPTVLAAFGLSRPMTMTGQDVFAAKKT